jgi:hypothetical protein
MTRPLSPHSSQVAADLIDQNYNAESIAGTVNNIRTQSGHNSLAACGPTYASWARTCSPMDPSPYAADEIRAFRLNRASISSGQPAFAGMPSRAASSSADMPVVSDDDPARFGYLAVPTAQTPLTASSWLPSAAVGDTGMVSVVDHLASEYSISPRIAALAARDTGAVRRGHEYNHRVAPYPAWSSISSGTSVSSSGMPARLPYVKLLPLLPEHRALLDGLPQGLNNRYRSCVNRFLCHLERNGKYWADFVPTERSVGWRSNEFEKEVDTSMRHAGLHTATRAALNNGFGMSLKLNLHPTWRNEIERPEHTALLDSIRDIAKPDDFAKIRRFLRFLERNQQSWAQLVPDSLQLGEFPAALQKAINFGFNNSLPESGTRSVINKVFGLGLRAESGLMKLKPVLPEHQVLLEHLPKTLNASYYSNVSRFLCHLEQNFQSWSALVPPGGLDTKRPPLLEGTVNQAIDEHGLSRHTRAAINKAFNFALKGAQQ